MHKKIILVGYMGSGKSTIALNIANKLYYKAIDLDSYIEKKENLSVQNIFHSKGEIVFRKLETIYLKEILETEENFVLSLGGGTPCYGNNLNLINESQNTVSIFLKTGIDELVKRLYIDKGKRPLIAHLKTSDELKEFIGKHLFERNFYYNQAGLTIKTDNKTTDAIAEEIIKKLF